MITQKKNGYSIVEILVYLAIFTSLSILVINSFIVVMSSFSATRTNRDLLESGMTSMERISREIRQAKNVDIANSNLGAGILQLNSTNQAGSSIVVKFSKESGSLNLYQCSGSGSCNTLIGNLLGQNISVTNLVFRQITTAQGGGIKIEMTLSDTRSKSAKSQNFYNTIILRGGY